MTISALTERAKKILQLVINNYIVTGSPIGSHALIKNYGLPWSAATVRATMAQLSNMGLMDKPHVSAGRIPTETGIRFYVDYLLSKVELSKNRRVNISRRYENMNATLDEVIAQTSSILSEVTHCAGLATLSRSNYMIVKSAELVKLARNRILVIFVLEGGVTERTVIRINKDIDAKMLDRMSGYLNDVAVGFTLGEMKTKVYEQLKNERKVYRELIESVFGFKNVIDRKEIRSEIYIKGQGSILQNASLEHPSQIKVLFKTFEEKDVLLRILETAMKEGGTRVYIGNANGVIEGYSVIVTPYGRDKRLGSIGVFGPMRMNYSQIIPVVEYTAGIVSKSIE